MANFGTDFSLRPLDNSTVTDRPAGPMLNVGEIARDYSERGRAVENAVHLGATLIELDRQNQYNTEMPKIREQMLQAEQAVTSDPADYATAQTAYGAHYATILDSINKLGYSDQVTQQLKHDAQGMYMTGQYRVNQFWKQNLTRDTSAKADNNVNSIIKSTAGTGAGSVPYTIAQQNIEDTYLPLSKPNSDNVSFLTAAQAQEAITSGKQKLALGDVDALLKSNPDKAIALIGKSYKETAYKDLSPEQWAAAKGAAQRVLDKYQAQQVAGTMQKIQDLGEAGINAGAINDKAMQTLINTLPAGSAARVVAQQYVRTAHMSVDVNSHFKDSSFPQMQAYVKTLQDAAKTTDPAKVDDAINKAQLGLQALQKAQAQYNADPTGYVLSQPSVQAAITKSGYPAGTPGYVQAGVQAVQIWDKQNGMTIPTPLIDNQEAAILRAKYDSSSENAQGTLQSLQKAYGPYYGAVQDQLFGKHGILPASAAVVDPNMDPRKFAQIHELDKLNLKALQAATPDVAPLKVEAAAKAQLQPFAQALGLTVVSPAAVQLVQKLAYKLMTGPNAQDSDYQTAVSDAVKTIYSNNYQLSGGIAYPKDMPAGSTVSRNPLDLSQPQKPDPNSIAGVNAYMKNVMLHVELHGLIPGSGAETMRRQQYLAAGGSSWLYQPNNQSWEWVNNDGAPISGPGGKPVVITRGQVASNLPFQNTSPTAIERRNEEDNSQTPPELVSPDLKKSLKDEKVAPKPVHLKIRR